MNIALWKQAFRDARLHLLFSAVLLFLFGWLFVWMQSLFQVGLWASFFSLLPDFVERLLGVPLAQLATPIGRLSFLYGHVISLLICLGWAIGRGSDVVGGALSRGNLELILTLPIRRAETLLAPSVVGILGALILAFSLWLGSWLGTSLVTLEGPVDIWRFLPGVFNLFSMTVALFGVTVLLSTCDNSRWRTMCLAGAFFVISSIVKAVGLLWEQGSWLLRFSFLTPYEPQQFILLEENAWRESWQANSILLAIGLVGLAAAGVVISRRDIPLSR